MRTIEGEDILIILIDIIKDATQSAIVIVVVTQTISRRGATAVAMGGIEVYRYIGVHTLGQC